jgi:pyrrolysine biosynthesis protein PylD
MLNSCNARIAVIPLSIGLGVIPGFSKIVVDILKYLHFESFVTVRTDVAGIGEAVGRGANILFVADDDNFSALNLKSRHVVDNDVATAKAYVTALEIAIKGLGEREILVMGLGRLGERMVDEIIKRGGRPLVYDVKCERMIYIKNRFCGRVRLMRSISEGLSSTRYVLNTAPSKNMVTSKMIDRNHVIYSPAVPHGLTGPAVRKLSKNFLHDPLQLGVATMAYEVISSEGV